MNKMNVNAIDGSHSQHINNNNINNNNRNTNHSHNCQQNRSSYLRYCSTQNPNTIVSQSSDRSDTHNDNNHNNQSLPSMSSFVTTNASQRANSNASNGRTTHHSLLNNQELNIELLTNQANDGLESAYNSDALDQTFVDALNMSQFVFDPFLSDGQSVASHVSNDSEENAYYSSDMSHIGSQNVVQTQTTTPFGLTMTPHITDIFSVFDSLTESDALTETLLNVNDHYCNSEPLESQQNLNTNSFLPQTHEQMQTTIQIPSNLTSSHIISNSPQVQLTPIVLSRPSIQTQQIIAQPLIQTTTELNSDPNQCTNDSSIVLRTETHSINKNRNSILIQNGFSNDSSLNTKDLIEETKCYKCIICNFIALEKTLVSNHINEKHGNERKDTSVDDSYKSLVNKKSNTYMCSRCYKGFPTLMACRQHMVNLHKLKVDNVTLQTIESDRNICHEEEKNTNTTKHNLKEVLIETHDNNINKKVSSKLRHILPNGKVEAQQQSGSTAKKSKQLLIAAKSHQNHNNNSNGNIHNNHMTAKRMAWKRKLKREQGSYICEFKGCSVRFRALENLQRHHRCHSDSGSGFVCCNCNKNSEHWPSMAGHLWRNHGIDLELHACEHCSYRTYSLSILENIHKRIHSTEKNFLCDTCGKGFKNCKQLINHKVKHVVKTVMKIHECHICLRTFTDARTKKVHLSTVHNKTRPYICSHCNHSAASRSALRTHMRQHTGEKPFRCDLCDYNTSDHNSLRRHKMRHSGERPYRCPFCTYACIQSSTYKQHLKNKHPGLSDGIMFNCEFCGFKTVNQDMYATHISEHNRNSEREGKNRDMGSTLVIAPDSPLQFACIVGQSISSQNNTPSISYASDFVK